MSSSACRSKRESGEPWEHMVRGAILSRAPEVGVLWILFRRRPFHRKEQSHGAPAIVSTENGCPLEIVFQGLLGAGARANPFHALPVQGDPELDRLPSSIRRWPKSDPSEPAFPEPLMNREADHAGGTELCIALGVIDHLVPQSILILMRQKSPKVRLQFLLVEGMVRSAWLQFTEHQGQPKGGKTIAPSPRGLAQGRVPVNPIGPETHGPHKLVVIAAGHEVAGIAL